MVISIDIGSRHIHIVEGDHSNGRFKIVRRVIALTPEQSVEGGEIIDEGLMVTKIRNTLEKHKIKSKKVIFSINPESVISRRFEIPNASQKEALSILQHELESKMSLSEQYLVDYTDIEKLENNMFGIEVVAIPKSLITQYLRICKKLQLKPVALDVHQNAIYKLIKTCDDIEYKNIIVADIGNTYMNLYLFSNGVRVFSKKVVIDTEQYERMLVSVGKIKKVNEDFKYITLSPENLERDSRLQNTMSLYLYTITDHIQRLIQFHSSRGTKDQSSPVMCIYVCGAMANMSGFINYIQSMIDTPVRPLNTIINKRTCECGEVEKFANAIGAMIRVK